MKNRCAFLFILLLFYCTISTAQTFIGTVLYRNAHQYCKVSFENNKATFSMPYVDGDTTYPIQGGVTDTRWIGSRGVEQWEFIPEIKGHVLSGMLRFSAGSQPLHFYKQTEPIPEKEFYKYEGAYTDAENRRVVLYSTSNFLRIMSPYSEETNSLKPIGPTEFWTASGETLIFSAPTNNVFTELTMCNQAGEKFVLTRLPPVEIKDLWIPVGQDTLFAQLYLPGAKKNMPACLLLPGGGGIGMDNYKYEARFFAAYGIASLLFDKSGNGKSKGPGNFQLQTFEEKNDQYITLFHYLRKYPGIDSTKVGIHGPSEGGRLALMMAIDLQDTVAYVNATAAPLMNFVDNQLYAMNHHHRAMGVPEIDNAQIQALWSLYYQEIFNQKIKQTTIDGFNEFRKKNPRLFIPGTTTQVPASPPKDDLFNDRVVKEAGKIRSPIFLQYGENDLRVDRVRSLQNFLPMLSKKVSVNTVLYERGNHSFMTPEYKICPSYAEDKIKWLQQIGIR